VDLLRLKGYKNIGFIAGPDSYEYPFIVLFGKDNEANDKPALTPRTDIHQEGETNVVSEQITADQIGGARIEHADHVEIHSGREERIAPSAPFSVRSPVPDFLGRSKELEELLAEFEHGALITGVTGGAGKIKSKRTKQF